MKGELLYAHSPTRQRIIWAIVYAIIIIGVLISTYFIGNKIATHSVPIGDVQLSIPYSKYLVGESVSFTLHNGFNSTVYVVNNCPSEPLEVFRLEDNTWVRIHDVVPVEQCPSTDREITLPANGTISGSYENWKNLFNKPGKYRIVAYVEYYNALPYQDFEVISKPTPPSVVPSNNAPATNTQKNDDTNTTEQTATTNLQSKIINVDGGSINVQYDVNNIYLISVTPTVGYTYQTSKGGSTLQVTFDNGSNQIQVQLSVSNGQLIVHTELDD